MIHLPTLNAFLNGIAASLLVLGYIMIRRRQVAAHRAAMIAAFSCSVLFMVSYVYYHYNVGSVRFQGTGNIRTFYFAILITHTILATLVPFMAALTLYRGLRDQVDKHRRLARWTLPIWLYVSVTGVIIYWMLYVMPGGGGRIAGG